MPPSALAREKRALERLRKLCLDLPETTEKEAWGEATWRVRGKMFAMLDNHHHGAPDFAVWLKSDFETQRVLVDSDPETFFVPPYQGKAGWVAARLDARTDWKGLAELIVEAWSRAAPAKLASARAAAARAPKRRTRRRGETT
jgi:hypothetical protein